MKRALLSLLMFLSPALHGLNILIDLGDVSFQTDTMASFKQIGLGNLASFIAAHPLKLPVISSHLRTRLFRFLNLAQPRNPEEVPARDEHDRLLPQILCDWVKGAKTNKEIREQLTTYLHDHPEKFRSQAEIDLLQAMATAIFTPDIFASTRKPVIAAHEFVQELSNEGHKLFVFSNWDHESLKHVQQLHPNFFAAFEDRLIVSSNIGTLKPDLAFYHKALTKHALTPEETVLFDDRPENVAAAQAVGITAFLVSKKSGWFSSEPDIAGARAAFRAWASGNEATQAS